MAKEGMIDKNRNLHFILMDKWLAYEMTSEELLEYMKKRGIKVAEF